jgi:hypothetical protein
MKQIVVPLMLLVSVGVVRGADETEARPKEEVREKLKELSPEERAKMRERLGLPTREEIEKRREELKNLSPEERQKRIEELRKTIQGKRQELKALTPEAREAKRQEIHGRFERRLEELRKRKAAGSLTPEEERRLQHFETLQKRFEKAGEGDAKKGEGTKPETTEKK